MNVAIIGTGKIGCDLLVKIMKEPKLNCCLFMGRREQSEGIKFAENFNVRTSTNGISAIDSLDCPIDLIFDATSASEHLQNQADLLKKSAYLINLTPAKVNFKCVPTVNVQDVINHNHISMITCGGQAVIPIAIALQKASNKVTYLETVVSISSKSAGMATRQNISQYQDITESGIKIFTNITAVKSILIINPAMPSIPMQITIYAKTENLNLQVLKDELNSVVNKIKLYASGYQLLSEPVIDEDRVVIMIKILGNGDYLPAYAGNLDIITSAAMRVAKYILENKYS